MCKARPSIFGTCLHRAIAVLGLWVLVSLVSSLGAAELPREIDGRVALGDGQLQMARDPQGVWGVNEAFERLQNDEFQTVQGNLGLGYSQDVIWLAVRVDLEGRAVGEWVLHVDPPTLDHVDVFLRNALGDIALSSGDALPFSGKPMAYRGIAVPLQLSMGANTLLLRIKTSSQLNVVPTLYRAEAFQRYWSGENYVLGAYFGVSFSFLLLGLLVAISLRRRIYVAYTAYVVLVTLYWLTFDGLMARFVFPNDVHLTNALLSVLLSLLAGGTTYLYVEMLRIQRPNWLTSAILWFSYLVSAWSVVSVPLGLFNPTLVGVTMALASVVFMIYSLKAVRSTDTELNIFGIAYLIYAPMVLITMALGLQLLPVQTWSIYSAQLGPLIHIAVMTLGIILKVREGELQGQAARDQLIATDREVKREREIREDQGQLLQMLGHEVRTPIAIIVSALDSLRLIDQGSAQDASKNLRFARMDKAIKRMELLMQLIGTQFRPDGAEGKTPSKERLDLTAMCRDNLILMADQDEHFDSKIPDRECAVWGDAAKLGFLLLNLFDNALKYSTRGQKISITLEMVTRGERQGFALKVCNAAHAFAPGMEERIFMKYVRADEHRNEPGLGLGLYLSRQIAQQHEGSLLAYNQGSDRVCFELWLPEAPLESLQA